jgi:hypothetical protein
VTAAAKAAYENTATKTRKRDKTIDAEHSENALDAAMRT